MKSFKTATLGLLALLTAVGISFAASTAPTGNAWIRISLLGSGYFLCVDTGFQCDEFGATTCKVDVLTINGLATVSGRNQFSCIAASTSNSSFAVGLYIPAYGLIQAAE